MKKLILASALALSLGGCATLASWTATVATDLSTQTPSQVSTLAAADLAADAGVKVALPIVNSGKLDRGTLIELQALRAGVRAALDKLHADNAAGRSLDFAVFNAALDAYNAYATEKGIVH